MSESSSYYSENTYHSENTPTEDSDARQENGQSSASNKSFSQLFSDVQRIKAERKKQEKTLNRIISGRPSYSGLYSPHEDIDEDGGEEKSLSEIISGRPSYSEIYSPYQAIRPEILSKDIWYPPPLYFDANIPPVADFDDDESLDVSITYVNEEDEEKKLAAIAAGEVIEDALSTGNSASSGNTDSDDTGNVGSASSPTSVSISLSSDSNPGSETIKHVSDKKASKEMPDKSDARNIDKTGNNDGGKSVYGSESIDGGESSDGSDASSGNSSSSSSLLPNSKKMLAQMKAKPIPQSKKVEFKDPSSVISTDSYQSYEFDSDDYETDSEEEPLEDKQSPLRSREGRAESPNELSGTPRAKSRKSLKMDNTAHSPSYSKIYNEPSSDSVGGKKRLNDNYGSDPEEVVREKKKKPAFFDRLRDFVSSGQKKRDRKVPLPSSPKNISTLPKKETKTDLSGINRNIATMNKDIATIKQEMTQPYLPQPSADDSSKLEMKNDISAIKQGLAVMNQNIAMIKAGMRGKHDSNRLTTDWNRKNFPDYNRSHRASNLPSGTTSNMSVHNTKAPSAALGPMSIPNYRSDGSSKNKVALSNMEPLSIGIPLTTKFDEESEDSRTLGHHLDPSWRKSNDEVTNIFSPLPRQVSLEDRVSLQNDNRMGPQQSLENETSRSDQQDYSHRPSAEQGKVIAQRGNYEQDLKNRFRATHGLGIGYGVPGDAGNEDSDFGEDVEVDGRSSNHIGSDPHQQRSENPSSDTKNRRKQLSAAFCCVVLLLLVCLGVGIWALLEYVIWEKEPVLVPTASPNGFTPSPSLTKAPSSDLRDKLIQIIRPFLSGDGESLDDPHSPQSQALDWLEQDSAVPDYNVEKILQRYSLATFYYSTDGDRWTKKDRWLSDSDECTWYSASSESPCLDKKYTHLVLGDNNIRGTLPPDISLLSGSLISFDVGGTISGSISNEYGALTNLRNLRLHGGEIGGEIPSSFNGFKFLVNLNLYGNRLTGSIPSNLFVAMMNLESLDLGKNRLSGTLSTDVGKLSNLRNFALQENNMSGAIPSEIGGMKQLTTLNFDSNKFSSLPGNVSRLRNLRFLSLRNNMISGTIPPELGELWQLRGLYLDHNKFRWRIPAQLGQLTNLEEGLDLSSNSLVGEIPSELGSLIYLKNLLLRDNELRGTVPSNLGNINRLHTLRLDNNNLSGSMPSELCTSFSRAFSTYYADCSEVSCPCCNFCCEDGSSQCTCTFEMTDPILCFI